LKKQRHQRPARRRKSIHGPGTKSAPRTEAEFSPENLSPADEADMRDALIRAIRALMTPEEHAEFWRLFMMEDEERSPEDQAAYERLDKTYRPTREQVLLEFNKLRAAREAKSRGSFVADVMAHVEITLAAVREVLTPEELAEFVVTEEVVFGEGDPPPGADAAVERLHALFDRYVSRIDRNKLLFRLHDEGLSQEQISQRWLTRAAQRPSWAATIKRAGGCGSDPPGQMAAVGPSSRHPSVAGAIIDPGWAATWRSPVSTRS
jgi:hypothetical protein